MEPKQPIDELQKQIKRNAAARDERRRKFFKQAEQLSKDLEQRTGARTTTAAPESGQTQQEITSSYISKDSEMGKDMSLVSFVGIYAAMPDKAVHYERFYRAIEPASKTLDYTPPIWSRGLYRDIAKRYTPFFVPKDPNDPASEQVLKKTETGQTLFQSISQAYGLEVGPHGVFFVGKPEDFTPQIAMDIISLSAVNGHFANNIVKLNGPPEHRYLMKQAVAHWNNNNPHHLLDMENPDIEFKKGRLSKTTNVPQELKKQWDKFAASEAAKPKRTSPEMFIEKEPNSALSHYLGDESGLLAPVVRKMIEDQKIDPEALANAANEIGQSVQDVYALLNNKGVISSPVITEDRPEKPDILIQSTFIPTQSSNIGSFFVAAALRGIDTREVRADIEQAHTKATDKDQHRSVQWREMRKIFKARSEGPEAKKAQAERTPKKANAQSEPQKTSEPKSNSSANTGELELRAVAPA